MTAFRDGTNPHNLKARGAAFSLPSLTQVEEGTGGTGVALCTCGWYSNILPSGRARKAAHAEHKANPTPTYHSDDETFAEDAAELVQEEEVKHHPVTDEEALELLNDIFGSEEPEAELVKDPREAAELLQELTEEIFGEEDFLTQVVCEARNWTGNYSIAFVPFTVKLAEAWGGLTVETKNTSAMLRHTYVTGERENVRRFMEQLDMLAAQALVELRSWQKENAASRRGLTDMQKYNQHREFIADFAAKVQWVK